MSLCDTCINVPGCENGVGGNEGEEVTYCSDYIRTQDQETLEEKIYDTKREVET